MSILQKDSFTFKKEEKLTSKKEIEKLFHSDSLFVYPFKVFYYSSGITEQKLPKVLISVSKKRFKRAVHRNKVKRLIRESYRLNKQVLLEKESNSQMNIGLVYVGKEIHDFHFMEKKLILVLTRLNSCLLQATI